MFFCASCSGKKQSQGNIQLYNNNLNIKKYGKVYYTVYHVNGSDIVEISTVSSNLTRYFLEPLGFDFDHITGEYIYKSEEYEKVLNSIENKENVLFVRCEFETGKSVPPVLKRELDGFITKHRTKTKIWLIDLKYNELQAFLKYERSSFDGKIPMEVLYNKLITQLK